MKQKRTNDLIYTFKITLAPSKPPFQYTRNVRLSVYPDHIIIDRRPDLKIKYNEIRTVDFVNGKIFLEYSGKSISFIIPSMLEEITDAHTTGLFIELIRDLKNKEYLPRIIHLIEEATKKKRRINKFIYSLIALSIVLFVGSFSSMILNYYTIGITLVWVAVACLGFILFVSLNKSGSELLLYNKIARVSSHYNLAEYFLSLLDENEKRTDEETRLYCLSKAMLHLEKIIELDPDSEYITLLRKHMFPQKYSNF